MDTVIEILAVVALLCVGYWAYKKGYLDRFIK